MLVEQREKDLGEPALLVAATTGRARERVRFLIHIESLVNVGCKYGPDDLPAHVWDELVTLSVERMRLERIIDRRRERQRTQNQQEMAARDKAGTPQPGQTLFPSSRPFR